MNVEGNSASQAAMRTPAGDAREKPEDVDSSSGERASGLNGRSAEVAWGGNGLGAEIRAGFGEAV